MKSNTRKGSEVGTLTNHVSDVGNRVSEFVSSNTEAARERLAHVYGGAKKNIAAKVKSSRVVIRARPLQSVFTALGIGLAVGAITGLFVGRRH